MRRLLTIPGLAAAATLTLAGCVTPEGDDGSQAKDATESSSPAEEESEEPEEEPAPAADPQGNYSSSCDYLLGDFSSYTKSGFRFVADATVKNTGNIGTVNEVKAIWFQAGGKRVVVTKKVQLEPGQRKRVGFTKQVGQDEIDLIQALNFDEQCKVVVSMVDTFGDVQG